METILFVEDSRSFSALFLSRAQRLLGIDIVAVHSFAEIKKRVEEEENPFSLAVLGLYLTDAPHGEAVHYLLSHHIPCIVLTGTFKPEIHQALIRKGVLDYFVKDSAGVIDAVIHAIQRFRQNRPIRILLVDDSRSVRQMLGQFLGRYGFQIFEAENGRQALDILQQQRIHLVICDYQMPEMNGIEMVKKLRVHSPRDQVAVIGLSSTEHKELPVEFIKSGANDFLVKPYQPEEMLCRVYQNIDIIERHEKMQGLLDQHRSILDNALDAIVIIDEAGKVLEYNPAAEKLFGFSKEAILGHEVVAFLIPESFRDGHRQALARNRLKPLEERHIQRRLELPGLRVDGRGIDLQLSLASIVQQEEIRYVAFIQDITDKKNLLNSLEETLAAAEKANKTKSEFMANMSHEIRTPMNAILGFTDLAQRANVPPKVQDYLEKIESASRSLMGIINDILDFSKIESGHLALDPVKFDLQQLLDQLSDLFSQQVAEKNIELVLMITDPFDDVLFGDAKRLEQVLINLIRNAIKFTAQGTITVICQPNRLANQQIQLHFSVKDTGIGIEPSIIEKLFDPFVQADSSVTRKFGGTGLGLSICKQLVTLMDGALWANSRPGEGSTFSFHVTVQYHSENRRQKNTLPESLRGRRVLLVDDNPMARQQVGRLLHDLTLETDFASSGREALAILKDEAGHPDPITSVFLDWGMPEMNGIDTAAELMALLSAQSPPVPLPTLFLLTPLGIEIPRLEGDKVGVHRYIDKPVTRKRLVRALVQEWEERSHQTERRSNTILGQEEVTGEKVGGSRILLVEDNEINRQIAQGIMERIGLVVECAEHGQEALEKLHQHPFDAVLMDVQMPVMDGLSATRRIRQMEGLQDLPIIALTAHTLPDEVNLCLQAGMNASLPKPIRSERLYGILSKWIPAMDLPKSEPLFDPATGTLPIIEGLDMAVGLEQISGNRKLYEKLLQRFRLEFGGMAEQMRLDLANLQFESMARNLHTLRGVADNLGALSLVQVTEPFEMAVKKQDKVGCHACMAPFVNRLNTLIDGLGGHKAENEEDISSSQVSALPGEVSMREQEVAPLIPLLAQLYAQLTRHSTGSLALLETLVIRCAKTPALPLFIQLRKMVQDYNFPEAIEFFDHLVDSWGLLPLPPPEEPKEPSTTRPKLLIVDDQRSNVDLLVNILTNYDLMVALNGPQALQVIDRCVMPDLILLDIMMPEMDGYEVCRRLKQQKESRKIPIIFVTAKKEIGDEEAGFEVGGVDYVTKPFNATIIRQRIKTHLELKQHRNELEALVEARTAELMDAKQLAELRREAAEAGTQEKSYFLAHMSHEIRTPLNAIVGMGELLQEAETAEERHRYLSTLLNASNSLHALVNDILDLSKIEAGQILLSDETFSLTRLVAEVIDVQRSLADQKGVALASHVEEALPDQRRGDPDRLKQILLNLVNNALKFTSEGEVRLSVATEESTKNSSEEAMEQTRFTVTDSGIGIESQHLEKIFHPFVQAEASTTRRYGGTGLGLTICTHLVEAMNGRIWAESEKGKGSRFMVSLPLPLQKGEGDADPTSEIGETASSVDPPSTGEAYAGQEITILAVDDSAENLLVVESYLSKGPYVITKASDGAEALEIFKTRRFDMVLMDMFMPVMDGYEATRQIRAWEKSHDVVATPILALTAQSMKEDLERTLVAGCNDHLTKPIRKKNLLASIGKLLQDKKSSA